MTKRSKTSWSRAAFTSDVFPTVCGCGEQVHMLRRSGVALIPSGHKCPFKDIQDGVMRTVAAEESAGIPVTPGELTRRLRDWGVGAALRPRP